MSPVPGIPPDIAMITGPTMVGIMLNWGFMGILCAQVYYYHEHFPEDRMLAKLLVYGLFVLDLLQTALVSADAFHWFVFGFGDMARLNDTFLNSWDVPLLDGVIGLIVQAFYCWRIYFLRKIYIIPVLILCVSITQCAAGIYTAVRAHQLGELSLIPTELVPQTIWLVGGAVADIAIAVVLSWALIRERKQSLPGTQSVITEIIRMTVETNALTAGVALLGLILFWGVPQHATLVVPPTAIIGKLYSNCLVAVFNNRVLRTGATRKPDVTSTGTHGMHSLHVPQRAQQGVKVQVVSATDLDYDIELEGRGSQKDARFG